MTTAFAVTTADGIHEERAIAKALAALGALHAADTLPDFDAPALAPAPSVFGGAAEVRCQMKFVG